MAHTGQNGTGEDFTVLKEKTFKTDDKKVCPICKGEKFVFYANKDGYEFYKQCECQMKKPKLEKENPFKEKEDDDTHGIADQAV